MAQSMTNWLGGFVNRELGAAFLWSLDRDELFSSGRFSEDGETLRIRVERSRLPVRSLVQLRKVKKLDHAEQHDSTPSPGTNQLKMEMVVSDGTAEVMASLDLHAYETLKAEVDELTLETSGDIFSIDSMVIVVRVFNESQARIELEIDALTYDFHLRRLHGNPTPIEDAPSIRRLLNLAMRYSFNKALPTQSQAVDSPTAHAQQEPNRNEAESFDLPPSIPSGAEINNESLAFETQVMQSQINGRRKARAASQIEEDGFEIMTGVNVEGPIRANTHIYTKPASPVERGRKELLLSLLGQTRKVANEAEPSHSRQGAQIVEAVPHQGLGEEKRVESSGTSSQQSLKTHPTELSRLSVEDDNSMEDDQKKSNHPDPQLSGPIEHSDQHDDFNTYTTQGTTHASLTSPISIATTSEPKQAEDSQDDVHTAVATRPRRDYGRRKLKSNDKQCELLGLPSSWRPAPPGHSLVGPNVPIDLLRYVKQRPTGEAATKINQVEDTGMESSASTQKGVDQDDQSSDEEMNSSEWPPSPSSAKLPLMPPDSSASPVRANPPQFSNPRDGKACQQTSTVLRPAPAESLTSSSPPAASPQKSLLGQRSANISTHNQAEVSSVVRFSSPEHFTARGEASTGSSPLISPDKPSPKQTSRERLSPRRVEAALFKTSLSSQPPNIPTESAPPSSAPVAGSKQHTRRTPSTTSTPSRQSKAPIVSDTTRPPRLSPSPLFSRKTSHQAAGPGSDQLHTVIRATPQIVPAATLSTPVAPQLPDPAAVYHAARSARLGEAQRYNWLRQHYETSRVSSDRPDLKQAYRDAYPRDRIGADLILHDVCTAFPELNDPSAGFHLHAVKTDAPGQTTSKHRRERISKHHRQPPPRRPPSPRFDRHGTLGPFARAFRNSRPGGYLHSSSPSDGSTPEPPYRVDVLRWRW